MKTVHETISAPVIPLRRSFAWLLTGNVAYAACQWGVLVAFARLGTPESLGRFALGLAISAPVVQFLSLQLRAVLATDAVGEHSFRDYFALRILTSLLALPVIAIVVAAAGYGREAALVILVVGAAKVVESLGDIIHGLFQQRERMEKIALSRSMKGVLSLAAVVVAMALTGDVLLAAAAMGAAWAVALMLYDLPCASRLLRALPGDGLGPRWDRSRQKRLVRTALPLGVVMLLVSLHANIPRYFLETHRGEEALGIFAALGYVVVAGNQVAIALWQAATPRLSRRLAAADFAGFRLLIGKLVLVAVGLGLAGLLVAVVAGGPLLELIYGATYAEYSSLFTILMAAAGAMYLSSLFGHALTAAREFDIQLPLSLVFALVTLGLCVWLIPTFGLEGAGWSVLVAAAVQVPIKALYLRRALNRRSS